MVNLQNAQKNFLNIHSRVVYTHLLVESHGRNPMASKELFAEDSKDILVHVIQEQISEIERCLVEDEENIVSALNDNNLDLVKTHLTKHSFFI